MTGDTDDDDSGGSGTALTYLEFYSGIGGWTLALERACRDIASDANLSASCAATSDDGETGAAITTRPRISVRRLASYDHSDLCNAVFAHNFIPTSVNDGDAGDDKKPSAAVNHQKKKQRRNNNNSAGRRPPPPPSSLPTYPIEKLTAADLASLNADIWAMSPPCQPHTRQHNHHSTEEELNDQRSQSFLHLIELMYELGSSGSNESDGKDGGTKKTLPRMILLENVVGFEASTSCQKYKQALENNGYVYAELHLNPTQVGIPNDRPRYYCCAVKNEERGSDEKTTAVDTASQKLMGMFQNTVSGTSPQSSHVHTSIPSLGVAEPGSPDIASVALPNIASYLDRDLPPCTKDAASVNSAKLKMVQISKKTVEKSAAWCFDIITQDDARSACFTSSYGKYVKGTGSVLYYGSDGSTMKDASMDDAVESKNEGRAADVFRLVDPKERSYDATWWERLVSGDSGSPPLRYLSGEEVARLMGFPLKEETASSDFTFSFPEWCTEKQKWRLLGNSINVAVSARIAELGMRMLLGKKIMATQIS